MLGLCVNTAEICDVLTREFPLPEYYYAVRVGVPLLINV
jgi:hypothetical protein